MRIILDAIRRVGRRSNSFHGVRFMRKKTCLALGVMICLFCCTGCYKEESSSHEQTTIHMTTMQTEITSQTDSMTESTETTETSAGLRDPELKDRIRTLSQLKQIPIPKEGWTDEELNKVVFVCGRSVELGYPFCMKDLLYGFNFQNDNEQAYFEKYTDQYYSSTIYLGKDYNTGDYYCAMDSPFIIGGLERDKMPNGIKLFADPIATAEEDSERYFVSVNCVTIGSTEKEVQERFGITRNDNITPDYFTAECNVGRLNILIMGDKDGVFSISIGMKGLWGG